MDECPSERHPCRARTFTQLNGDHRPIARKHVGHQFVARQRARRHVRIIWEDLPQGRRPPRPSPSSNPGATAATVSLTVPAVAEQRSTCNPIFGCSSPHQRSTQRGSRYVLVTRTSRASHPPRPPQEDSRAPRESPLPIWTCPPFHSPHLGTVPTAPFCDRHPTNASMLIGMQASAPDPRPCSGATL